MANILPFSNITGYIQLQPLQQVDSPNSEIFQSILGFSYVLSYIHFTCIYVCVCQTLLFVLGALGGAPLTHFLMRFPAGDVCVCICSLSRNKVKESFLPSSDIFCFRSVCLFLFGVFPVSSFDFTCAALFSYSGKQGVLTFGLHFTE